MERARPVGRAGRGADGAGSLDARAMRARWSHCRKRFEVRGISKSAVSERFVYGTQRKLAELMSRDLRRLALVALLIDGVHFGEHVVLAAVGVESTATSTCWGCARARPRTPRPARRCWPIWSSAG